METLLSHRSVRKYKLDSIPDELLYSILVASFRGSTTGNMQLYSVVVTKSPSQKEKLAPLHFNQPMIKTAPVVLTFCADFNRFSKWCLINNAEPGYDNFLSFTTAVIDTTIVAQNFCVAAEDKGLGICYLGTTTYNAPEIIEVLNLPKLVFPVTTITVGWPESIPDKTDRLPLEGIVHNETYQDYNKSSIERIYSFKENMQESKKFIEENKKENLAQVFTDVRYKKKDNEFFSKKMLKTLKSQGFL